MQFSYKSNITTQKNNFDENPGYYAVQTAYEQYLTIEILCKNCNYKKKMLTILVNSFHHLRIEIRFNPIMEPSQRAQVLFRNRILIC